MKVGIEPSLGESRGWSPSCLQSCYYSLRGEGFRVREIRDSMLKGQQDKAIYLIQRVSRQSLSQKDSSDRTLVDLSMDLNAKKVLKHLIDSDVSVLRHSFVNHSILKKRMELVALLVEEGIDLSEADKDGKLPLDYALKTADMRVIREIVNKMSWGELSAPREGGSFVEKVNCSDNSFSGRKEEISRLIDSRGQN